MTESSSQHHPDALPIGTVLGDFAITGLIGEGGFGIVYLAYEATLDRTVAIKEYLPVTIAARTAELTVAVRSHGNRDAYTAGLQSFLREARMQARFSHPAMLEVYRVWEQHGTAYMAMRYYPGDTLRNLRKAATSSHVFDETAIQRVMMPVFDALGELHSQSVLHRDVSPDNILIMPTGQPVLLDFGAARNVVAGAAQSLTTVLKPGYAPIEQYADDGTMEQGPWTDVYGLGAVLYFLAMGSPPSQAVTRLMGGSLHAFEESASALYSPTFIDAVKRALAVRPEARLQSVDALREALGWSWARTSELPPTTYIVPPDVTTSARNASGDPAADTKPAARVGERIAATSPKVLEATVAPDPLPSSTQVADAMDKANAAGAQVRNLAEPLVATRSTSKLKTALIVGVMLMVLAAVAWKFLFKSGVTHTATPPLANPPSATSPSAPAVTPPEHKPEPAAQNVGSSAAPAQSPSTSLSLSGKPASPNASPATDKASPKASSATAKNAAAPMVNGVEPTEDTPRAVTAPPIAKPARPARSPIDPVEPGDSGFDPEVASKLRGTGKTSSEVCERLLAKLSLGTDELTSTERRQLSSCR
ncbi:MAG TPA: protein kinase [Casimicrobium sp.]|nr:protein kinase [Casimicrobium sp.]